MLRADCISDNNSYLSWDENNYKFIKDNRDLFECPSCKQKLIFVDGIEVIKHFRHMSLSDCEWEPESQNHLEMKKFMKELLNLSNDDLEVNLGFAIPDLFLKEQKVAIEVQNSKITKRKFLDRCYNYTQNGIAVMWVFHEKLLDITKEAQNIPSLIRAAAENSFGRVYIYSDNKLTSVRFNPFYRWIDEFYDNSTGENVGGYLKKYKKKKAIEIIQEIPDDIYGVEIIRVNSKWNGNNPSGYLIAKFYDI